MRNSMATTSWPNSSARHSGSARRAASWVRICWHLDCAIRTDPRRYHQESKLGCCQQPRARPGVAPRDPCLRHPVSRLLMSAQSFNAITCLAVRAGENGSRRPMKHRGDQQVQSRLIDVREWPQRWRLLSIAMQGYVLRVSVRATATGAPRPRSSVGNTWARPPV
jgi:hypothetical protein